MKNKRGITLIALVVTIIIILLLAGVSIQMLSGNNGVLIRAKDAKNQMLDAQDMEVLKLKIIESSLDNGTPNAEVLVSKLQEMGCIISGESYPLTVSYNEKNYKIQSNGIILNDDVGDVNYFPEGYKEVEYIESTGIQYIDTGYIPKTNTKLELTLSFSGEFSPSEPNTVIFSAGSSEEDNIFALNFGGDMDRI